MARQRLFEELDDALEALMNDPDPPLPRVSPRLDELLRVADALRGLPRAQFREQLKADLLAEASARQPAVTASPGGKPVATLEDIRARLDEMAHEPKMVAYDVRAALSDLPEMTMRFLASLNQCTLGVSRFSADSHWERHPAGDELLHFLEGSADILTLTDAGPVRATVSAGSLFVCRRGLWHRVLPRSPIAMLFATPGEATEHSNAADPRREAGRGMTRPRRGGEIPELVAHALESTLAELPELAITSDTTAEEARAAVRTITSFDQSTLGMMRYSGLTPWERHPAGDELLHVLEGEVDVTVLTDDGPVEVNVRAGSVFVCPRGLWHRQRPRPAVTMLFGTPTATEEVSWAEDPRVGE